MPLNQRHTLFKGTRSSKAHALQKHTLFNPPCVGSNRVKHQVTLHEGGLQLHLRCCFEGKLPFQVGFTLETHRHKGKTCGCGSNDRYQNGTLVSGNMDQNLLNPSCLILSHTHVHVSAPASPHQALRGARLRVDVVVFTAAIAERRRSAEWSQASGPAESFRHGGGVGLGGGGGGVPDLERWCCCFVMFCFFLVGEVEVINTPPIGGEWWLGDLMPVFVFVAWGRELQPELVVGGGLNIVWTYYYHLRVGPRRV